MKLIAFSALALTSMAAVAQPEFDALKASFDRTLAPIPIAAAARAPAVPDVGEDPLRTAVLAVLWNDKPAYHVPPVARAPLLPQRPENAGDACAVLHAVTNKC